MRGKVGRYALLTVLALIVLFPIYITIVNSLLRPADITRQPPTLFPTDPQWRSYADAWNAGHMGTYLKNSFIVTFIITVGQVLTAILAGYAFAFLEFPFKRTLFVVFLATLMVPFEVTIVTNVATISDLGWYNTYAGLAVPFLATGFGAFLMRQAFLTAAARPARRRRARRLRALAVPVAGRGAARAARRSPRSPCSRSSPRGTSTSGRCSSPRTTSSARCRSA